jgi:hypothetical protein
VISVLYISKGVVRHHSTEQILYVLRCGDEFQLVGTQAALWLNGRFGFSSAKTIIEQKELGQLVRMGLAETAGDDVAGRYRALTQCVICPAANKKLFRMPLFGEEAVLMKWLSQAGLRLTMAELVFLYEHGIRPNSTLLYERNRQTLTETIYTKATIADNVLEIQMEKVPARDKTVKLLLRLLAKKKILLL